MALLQDLNLFVVVARARSFSAAARVLSLPVSTVSRRLADLETALGVKLLVRSTRRVELTEAGVLLLGRGEAIVEAARDAEAAVRDLAETPTGVLRVSVEAEIGPILVAPVVAEYCARHPGVRLELDLSPRRVDLLAEGFDLAIRLGRLQDSSLTVRQLALLQVGLFASPAYLAKRGVPREPAELAAHARLHLWHQADDGAWRLADADQRQAVVGGLGAVWANNMMMVRALARLHAGVAVLDEVMAGEDVANGLLRRVLPGWSLPPVAVSAITPGRLLPAKTRLFVDMLARRFSDR